MKVLLIDADGKLPNIALHKLAIWHENQGDEVTWDMPLFLDRADKVYISTILTKSWSKVENLVGLRPDAVVGGTGTWGFIEPPPKVQLPPEVEAVKARINYGFTTRGCIRHCPFCLVPVVEGNIHVTGDIYDVWDGKAKTLTLFDNNILAIPDHFERIVAQLVAEDLIVDWNQGLDIRLINDRTIALLRKLKMRRLRFAFDDPNMAAVVEEKVALVRQAGLNHDVFFYVLVGFNTTFEEDLARLNLLRRLKCRAYVMRYDTVYLQRKYVELARWANMFWPFSKYEFEAFRRKGAE